jgi:polyisoprenoid-binding protein YceI
MLKAQWIGALSAIALLTSLSALAQTSTWNIDSAHSTAQFTVRHLGISNVTGSFSKVTGSVVLNEKDIAQSQVSASVDLSSVDTRPMTRSPDHPIVGVLSNCGYPSRRKEQSTTPAF